MINSARRVLTLAPLCSKVCCTRPLFLRFHGVHVVLASPPACLSLKRPVPPWPAPRHRRVLRRCYLVSSPIITSDVAPSFAASSTHLRCVVTAAACFSKLRRRPPVFDGPDCALAALGYQRPPLRASFHAFFIFTSRPPSPSRDRGSPPCVSRRSRRLTLRPCAAILISLRLSFFLFPEGVGERFCVSSGRDPM